MRVMAIGGLLLAGQLLTTMAIATVAMTMRATMAGWWFLAGV